MKIKCPRCKKEATIDKTDITIVCPHCHLSQWLMSRAQFHQLIKEGKIYE